MDFAAFQMTMATPSLEWYTHFTILRFLAPHCNCYWLCLQATCCRIFLPETPKLGDTCCKVSGRHHKGIRTTAAPYSTLEDMSSSLAAWDPSVLTLAEPSFQNSQGLTEQWPCFQSLPFDMAGKFHFVPLFLPYTWPHFKPLCQALLYFMSCVVDQFFSCLLFTGPTGVCPEAFSKLHIFKCKVKKEFIPSFFRIVQDIQRIWHIPGLRSLFFNQHSNFLQCSSRVPMNICLYCDLQNTTMLPVPRGRSRSVVQLPYLTHCNNLRTWRNSP